MIANTKKEKLFSQPKTLFQQRISDILHQLDSTELVKDLISLYLFKETEKASYFLPLIKLYNELGLEKFCDVIAVLEKETVIFPSMDSFQETIEIALCFYLKQYKNMGWKEIKELVKEEDLSGVKLGINIGKFQKFLDYISEQKLFKYAQEAGITPENFAIIKKMSEPEINNTEEVEKEEEKEKDEDYKTLWRKPKKKKNEEEEDYEDYENEEIINIYEEEI